MQIPCTPAEQTLLSRYKVRDPEALPQLVSLLYDELHQLARRCLRGEHQVSLCSTALLHEAYLRLALQRPGEIIDRGHFLGVAAHVMRQVLVDYVRSRRSIKRDGGIQVVLEDDMHPLCITDIDLICLDKALETLAQLDKQQAQIVELRFFGGLSVEETAEVVGLSPTTVKREWSSARAWLYRELSEAPGR